jgi:hypothetical protein
MVRVGNNVLNPQLFEPGLIDSMKTINPLINERMLPVKAEGETYQLFALRFQIQNKT